jgi:LmbE family N-acetylglucosaminyl deacetylase
MPLRLLILGAHPDDPDFHAGGLAAIYRRHGHVVKMISLTNGDAGHHRLAGRELADIRRAEAAAAGRVIGAEYVTWDHHDAQLEPTLALRWQVIRELRTFQPDLVLAHRTDDYHPDHRAVGHVVRDASFLITVPTVTPETPILRRAPIFAYLPDRFTKPTPLRGDVVVDTTGVVDAVVEMLAAHRSQVFEWLPFNQGVEDQVPSDRAAQVEWLRGWYLERLRPYADRYRAELIATYGPVRGSRIQFAEVFEISEYGAPLDDTARERLFGFC